MEDILIPIDQAGRIVLPTHVRQELAIQPGDMLKRSIQGTRVTLALSEGKAGFQRKGKALVFMTASEETFGHEVLDTLLTELRGERLLLTASERRARKQEA